MRDDLVVGEDVDAGEGQGIGGLPGVVGDMKDRRWVAGKVGPSQIAMNALRTCDARLPPSDRNVFWQYGANVLTHEIRRLENAFRRIQEC